MRSFARVAVTSLAVAAPVGIGLWIFPFDSDGAFAVHDGIWYAIGAETDPGRSISPHHPLFHALAGIVTTGARALGLDHPGHLAVRVVSGLGGACLLLQIVAAASRRFLIGGAFALLMLASRGFIVETAAGENVIPAAAAALGAITLASRPAPGLVATGALTAIALWLRKDNIFIVPGVMIGVGMGRPAGERLSAVVRLIAGTGAVTLLGYFAAWMAASPGEAFHRWLLRDFRPWIGGGDLTFERFRCYLSSITVATTGQLWTFDESRPLTGVLFLLAVLASGVLLIGTAPRTRMALPILATLVGRACFHTWFEADNFEWLLLPIALVIAFASGLARGEPATSPLLRFSGVAILLVLVAWMLAGHARSTWRLRERRLMSMVEESVAGPRKGWRLLAQGGRAGTALKLLGLPYEEIAGSPNDIQKTFGAVVSALAARPGPTVVVTDRLVINGMPWIMDHYRSWRFDYDEVQDAPNVQTVRREGLICAWLITPPTTRPDSRE